MKPSLYCSEPPGCICEKCLYYWSSRCPHGSCYDDLRAKINPYDKAHPGEPPRTYWSDWKEDQAAWCRGGIFYQTHECDSFVEYKDSTAKECLDAMVQVYQDGYVKCSLVESVGCEECMRRFEEKQVKKEAAEVAKKTKIEQKTCSHWKGSSGPAMPEMYIECRGGRIAFQSEDEFNRQFDICTHRPEDCKIVKDRELLSQLIGKEIRTHYNTGGIVFNISGPHTAYGPGSWTINYTEDGKKRKNPCIINSIKVENGIITCDGKPLQIIEPKKDDETCEESQKNTGSVSCVAGTQEDSVTSNVDKPTVMTAQDSNDTKIQTCATCQANKEDCQPYQACMSEGLDPEECVCNNWSGKAEGNEMIDNTRKTAENDDFLPENVTKTDEIVTFDYSSVDEETGTFLQEKANRITEIRIKSVFAIGKELKEAQDKLANNKTGTFGIWVQSIGFSRQTAQNYIQGYDYIVKNFDNIELAENIQPSLLFAVSKPSAPPELQQAVLSGDITTHKQYKELEEQLRKKEHELASAKEYADKQAKYADEHMMRARTAEFELEKNKKAYDSLEIELRHVKQQLEQAKRNSDPSKVQELGQIISEKQKEIEDLRQQLRDKPIEATASRVVEKLPDDVQEYLSSVDTTIHHMQNYATVNMVLNLVVGLSTEELQSWAMMMNNRKAVGDDEEAETLELLAMAIQSLQDMMDDYESRRCE